MITTKKILTAGAVVAALSSMSYAAWSALDYTELRPVLIREYRITQQAIDEIGKSVLLLRFQNLMEAQKRGGLSFADRQELCRIARVLGYVGVPGCP